MSGFQKGNVYVVSSRNGYWYIVRQVGMKSWVAMEISNNDLPNLEYGFFKGNGQSLWTLLDPLDYKRVPTIASHKTVLRRALYTVARYGSF